MSSAANGYRATMVSDRRWLIRHWFYVAILGLAWAQILLFPDRQHFFAHPVTLGVLASVYTAFKMVQPLRWHESRSANTVLFAADLAVCGGLVILSGGPHSPFILYSLAPVVTAAILLPGFQTFLIAAVTFSYVLAAFVIHAAMSPGVMDHFSDLATYLVALVLSAALPYFMNAKARQAMRMQAILSERQKLAREIHDNLCQTINGLRWQVQMLRHGIVQPGVAPFDDKVDELIEKVDSDARSLISSLRNFRPGRSLPSDLKALLDGLRAQYGTIGSFREQGRSLEVDDLVKSEVTSICEEALRNAARHSGCRHVSVDLINSGDLVKVIISDDGKGFDTSLRKEGRGLWVMRERAESVGGSLEILSRTGAGTEIRLEVPRRCPSDLVLPVR